MSAAHTISPQAQAAEFERETREEVKVSGLGFWLYLMSDAVIFAMFFVTYVVMQKNIVNGPAPAQIYHVSSAAWETAALLLSSLTFGFSSVALAAGKRSMVMVWLLITAIIGVCFLVMEVREFMTVIDQHSDAKYLAFQLSGFLASFFSLVGLHGLHVTFGIIWIIVMIIQVSSKGLTGPVASRMNRLGYFWHFLDIIWIGIFSVVYLPGILSGVAQ